MKKNKKKHFLKNSPFFLFFLFELFTFTFVGCCLFFFALYSNRFASHTHTHTSREKRDKSSLVISAAAAGGWQANGGRPSKRI
jgi:capsule polysaccharide export protein KpsE/RkpR